MTMKLESKESGKQPWREQRLGRKGKKSSMAKEGKNFTILTVLLVSWT